MARASDAPLLQAALTVYERFDATLRDMKANARDTAELVAIAAVAEDVGTHIKGIRVRLNRLGLSCRAALSS